MRVPPLLVATAALLASAGAASAQVGGAPAPVTPAPPTYEPIVWHSSIARGYPWDGRLVRGVRLPPAGVDFITWDPINEVLPNRSSRRWGHDRLIRKLLRVLARYRAANPGVPRVVIGDISRRRGGIFDERFGGLGHRSHQNGLDVDVYYPRVDRLEEPPTRVRHVDQVLAQALVDQFVAAKARYVFTGPHLDLTGPRRVVQKLVYHDDHMHVRVRRRKSGR